MNVVFDTEYNDVERKTAADVGSTTLADVSYLIADSFDGRFVCVLRLSQLERTHTNSIHVSGIGKKFLKIFVD